MSESQVERIAERIMDGLDRRYMRGELTAARYQRRVRALDRWAARQLRKRRG